MVFFSVKKQKTKKSLKKNVFGQSVGRSVDWSVGQSIGRSVDWLVGQSNERQRKGLSKSGLIFTVR